MPTLNWIGKDAVIRHHKEVPFRLLEADAGLSHGGDTGNLIVQGDNLHALKALLPKYAGKVKCIYIDPPYNTGNEGWVYNDKVNSPEINRWLGSVVGKEAEDLSRHDKWLCMMYPRMVLLKQFLAEDGVILISLDEVEAGFLRLLLDEIFQPSNRLATIVWATRNTDNRVKSNLSSDHEYIFVYGNSPDAKIEGRVIDRSDFKNGDNDKRGPYVTDPLKGKATAAERPNLHAFNIVNPDTGDLWKPDPAKGWITDEAGYKSLLADDRFWWPPDPSTGWPRKKRFLTETSVRMPASTFWPEFKTSSGARELDEILDERLFAFPKPINLVQRIVDYCCPPDGIILDSFAGSGTTGHAVLKQNVEDGGTRKFILVEMEGKIARDITAERVRRVAGGYTNAKGEAVAGLGGGFQFCTLSEEPLFNEFGDIRDDVRFAQLADFVWFAETGEGYTGKADSPLLGAKGGTAVYLLFNGILGDRRPEGGNILTQAVLDGLPPHDGPKVIYAAAVKGLGPAALQRAGIVFKQTPYAIEV